MHENMNYIAINYVNYWELPKRNMMLTESQKTSIIRKDYGW